jgi:hypothetical protein
VKRIGREPVVRRTTKFVERHVVKSSAAAIVPSIVNDTLFHHQAITPDAIFHIVSDDVSVSSMMALATILMRLL